MGDMDYIKHILNLLVATMIIVMKIVVATMVDILMAAMAEGFLVMDNSPREVVTVPMAAKAYVGG